MKYTAAFHQSVHVKCPSHTTESQTLQWSTFLSLHGKVYFQNKRSTLLKHLQQL